MNLIKWNQGDSFTIILQTNYQSVPPKKDEVERKNIQKLHTVFLQSYLRGILC